MTEEITWEPAEWVQGARYPEGAALRLRVGDVVAEVFPDPLPHTSPRTRDRADYAYRVTRIRAHAGKQRFERLRSGFAFQSREVAQLSVMDFLVAEGILVQEPRYFSAEALGQTSMASVGKECESTQTRSGLPCRHRVKPGATSCAAGHPVSA